MKKALAILTAFTLALGMTACAGKDSSSTLKVGDLTTTAPADTSGSDTSGTDNSSSENERYGADGDITAADRSMGVSIFDENGKILITGQPGYEPQNINKGFKVTKWGDVVLDVKGDVNANIYVFCNGQMIKHSLEENGEYTEKTTVTLPNGEVEKPFDIYIAPTDLGKVERGMMWVCFEYEPDYVPKSNLGEIALLECSYMPVSSDGEAAEEALSVYEAQEQDYIYGEHPIASGETPTYETTENEEWVVDDSEVHDIDIGRYDEQLHSTSARSANDIAVIDKDADFAVTAYMEEDVNYYLVVFCDGQPINAFDGKMFMKINCQGGKRMVKYSLDKEQLPENGDHSYSVLALSDQEIVVEGPHGTPMNSPDSSLQSNRRLVKIEK